MPPAEIRASGFFAFKYREIQYLREKSGAVPKMLCRPSGNVPDYRHPGRGGGDPCSDQPVRPAHNGGSRNYRTRDRIGYSAGRLSSRTGYPEFLHFVLQGCPLHSESGCRTGRATDNPAGLIQSANDMLPFQVNQSRVLRMAER